MAAHEAIEQRGKEEQSIFKVEETFAPPTPMSLMQIAVQGGASVDALAKLMELQLRWEQNESRKAFEQAFAAFKKEAPRLEKTKEVSFGPGKTAYKFTPLDVIANEVGPVLAKHGLSYNWDQSDQHDGLISVTCTLRHVAGHFITNTLIGPNDHSGSKNGVQAIGSTTSYLRRYTLLGVLGMATSDEDTDGMTIANAADFVMNIEAAADLTELQRVYIEAAKAAQKAEDYKAMKVFRDAKDRRKAELQRAQ